MHARVLASLYTQSGDREMVHHSMHKYPQLASSSKSYSAAPNHSKDKLSLRSLSSSTPRPRSCSGENGDRRDPGDDQAAAQRGPPRHGGPRQPEGDRAAPARAVLLREHPAVGGADAPRAVGGGGGGGSGGWSG
jgi:hypothetical protein